MPAHRFPPPRSVEEIAVNIAQLPELLRPQE
jgi:hypothetical protein